MILVVIRLDIRPEQREEFLRGIIRYSAQVRAEPSNPQFTCYESVEGSHEFVVVANYADPTAGEAHVKSEHAQAFFGWLPSVVASVPRIVSQDLGGVEWAPMGEIRLD